MIWRLKKRLHVSALQFIQLVFVLQFTVRYSFWNIFLIANGSIVKNILSQKFELVFEKNVFFSQEMLDMSTIC